MLNKSKLPKLSSVLLSVGLSASLTTLVNAAAAPETTAGAADKSTSEQAGAGAVCESPALDAGPKIAERESPVLDAGPRLPEAVATAAQLAELKVAAGRLAQTHATRIDVVEGLVNQHAPIINTHDGAINNHKEHIDKHASAIDQHAAAIENHKVFIDTHEARIAALERELSLRPTYTRMAVAVGLGVAAGIATDRAMRDRRCTIM